MYIHSIYTYIYVYIHIYMYICIYTVYIHIHSAVYAYRYMYRDQDFNENIGERIIRQIDRQKLWLYLTAFRCQITKESYKIIR